MDRSAFETKARPSGGDAPQLEQYRHSPSSVMEASLPPLVLGLGIVFTVVIFYTTCYAVVVNGPLLDDYSAVLRFVIKWSNGQSLSQLIEARNDHRIVLTRLFTLLDLKLNGSVNFQHLGLYGVLAMVPIALTLYALLLQFAGVRELYTRNAYLVLLTLLTWLVFRPEHVKHIAYPMANITALWSVAFALLFFFSISKPGSHYLALALVALVGALGSNSSSLLLLPLAAVKFGVERRWLRAGVALVVGVICGIAYSAGGVTIPNMIAALRHDLLPALTFFFALVGASTFQFDPTRLFLPFLTGLLIAAACAVVFVRTRNVNLLIIFAYLLLCDALIALGRVAVYRGQLMEIALDGRYRIYSVVLVALLAGLLFCRLYERSFWKADQQPYATAVVAISALLCLNSYVSQVPQLMLWHNVQYRVITDNARDSPPPPTKLPESWAQAIKIAVRKGLYIPPP